LFITEQPFLNNNNQHEFAQLFTASL